MDERARRRHGVYFTDPALVRFAQWLAREHAGDLGASHRVVDPACGSGNLVASHGGALDLSGAVVSDIDDDALVLAERVARVARGPDGRGLNFLSTSAGEYLDAIARGRSDRPLAFFCNPPYRNDDDQFANRAPYRIHSSIPELIGADAAAERYACFLAQMKLACDAARARGWPPGAVLVLFTKSAWLTGRPAFRALRRAMTRDFDLLAGVMVDASEFFEVSGRFPVAVTVWRERDAPRAAAADVRLLDLTWVRRPDLERFDGAILRSPRTREVTFRDGEPSIRVWSETTSVDFKRSRRKGELPGAPCGLPRGDRRASNKKAYGEATGSFIGFMDDLVPCRIAREPPRGAPWFRLDVPVMDCRKARCFSGPPDQKGFCASDPARADRLFVWFAIQRTLADRGYPMWADAMELWPPRVPPTLADDVRTIALAIALAENECVEARFPAGDPVPGAPAIAVGNPMSPADAGSFWSRALAPAFEGRRGHASARAIVDAVVDLYRVWGDERDRGELSRDAGILQIKRHADAAGLARVRAAATNVDAALREVRGVFHAMLTDRRALAYFERR